jgi:hypothetical protein
MTLAALSLFAIADITNPRSAYLELQATVPGYIIPFVPIIAEGEPSFPMFRDLQIKHDWVLDVLTYDSIDHLLAGLQDAVIAPALQKHEALVQRRARDVGARHIQQYLPHGGARPQPTRLWVTPDDISPVVVVQAYELIEELEEGG